MADLVMRWEFSDGTTVDLGGKVEGASAVAEELRADLAKPFRIGIWPEPDSGVDFDANDPALVEAWLQHELDYWTRLRDLPLTLKSPDGIPPLPPPPWGDGPDGPDGEFVVH